MIQISARFCSDLFFGKQLSLVVYKKDQWTKKTAIKIFLVLELKVKNSTILTFSQIYYVKNWRNPSDFFFIKEYKKVE